MTNLDTLLNELDKKKDTNEGYKYIEVCKLIEACRVMREELALMSEGEGPDHTVYIKMAKSVLAKVEEICKVSGT